MRFDLNIKDFNTINEFWAFIIQHDKWYLKYSPHNTKGIDNYLPQLEPWIINQTNDLRKKMDFSYDDYVKVIEWDNWLIRADMAKSKKFNRNKAFKFKQFCFACKKEISFFQRYPKCICRACVDETTDLQGRKVEFFNTEALGHGCQGYYSGTNQTEKYDTNTCYLNGNEYFAKEARFGGIVIQVKE